MHDSARANRELVRNLAHEIKNPLGGIRGAADVDAVGALGIDGVVVGRAWLEGSISL